MSVPLSTDGAPTLLWAAGGSVLRPVGPRSGGANLRPKLGGPEALVPVVLVTGEEPPALDGPPGQIGRCRDWDGAWDGARAGWRVVVELGCGGGSRGDAAPGA